MQAIAQRLQTEEPAHPEFNTVNTTLYDLIEAIDEELQPGGDRLVSQIVLDLLDRGMIKLSDSMKEQIKEIAPFKNLNDESNYN